ncbi:hypothetical protein GFY24_23250 [Nocardia sp. SYP-A9097]|uniref:hypothetical protein n=1 Tax=Nocardia sp. SYP-A9097 TaxID=2663237 RepID=UPI00129A2C4C|nr:hypothetical protein [Nocardia sp. SYP-A9097]MRH90320.1 hypothetical protein [Nocardia sp. SYP-A9097]
MSRSGEGRFEEIARKARRVQESVERVRGVAAGEGVRIEVAADGRIIDLRLTEPGLAQAISRRHEQALARACASAAELRREVVSDPAIARALRTLLESAPIAAENSVCEPPTDAHESNPYALPVNVRRRYGLG